MIERGTIDPGKAAKSIEKGTFVYVFKVQLKSMGHSLRDLILNCLFNDWCSNYYLRPFFLRCFGMKCGSRVKVSKCKFIGSLRDIEIGDNSMVNREVFFNVGGRITIGKNVNVGFQAAFVTGHHDIGSTCCRCGTLVRKDIVIEDGAWIAARAFIGPGVTIGAGSIVAAGAVVMRSMPPNSLIAGNPARVIRKLEG